MSVRRRLLDSRVSIVRRSASATQDPYGDAVVTDESRVDDVPARLSRTSVRELSDDRATVVEEWTVVLPAGTALDAGDRLEHAGSVWEVDGPPERVRVPGRRTESHVTARARAILGG